MEKLIDFGKFPTLKQFASDSKSNDIKLTTIKMLCRNNTAKYAADYIKEWKLDIDDFPEIKERLMKNSMRYYIGRHF
jgi:hypothetical protein